MGVIRKIANFNGLKNMPRESNRITRNKRISLPAGDVLFPIIKRITFKDIIDRGQETQYTIDNSEQGDRDVHTAFVGAPFSPNATEDTAGADTPGDCIAVERVDRWRVKDVIDRGQQTYQSIDNITHDADGPPFFTTHAKTRILRVQNDPDNGLWIETEVIDKFQLKDVVDRGQQTYYELNNPIGEDDGNGNMIITANPDDIEEDDTGGIIDPAWRTDPFQNITNISGNFITTVGFTPINFRNEVAPTFSDTGILAIPPGVGDMYKTNPPGPLMFNVDLTINGNTGDNGFGSSLGFDIDPVALVRDTSGNNWTGGPSVSYSSLTFAPSAGLWLGPYFGSPFNPLQVTGIPLVINEKPIPGYIDTLVAISSVNWVPLHDYVVRYETLTPISNWYSSDSPVAAATIIVIDTSQHYDFVDSALMYSVTSTVSPTPFSVTLGDKTVWLQAVGLRDQTPPFSNHTEEELTDPASPFFVPGYVNYGIVCCIGIPPP